MNDRQLERLLAQLAEHDELFAPAARPAIGARPIARLRILGIGSLLPLAAAAAIAIFMLRVPNRVTRQPDPSNRSVSLADASPLPISVEHCTGKCESGTRQDVFQPCSDEDAFALVLYRTWSHDNRGLVWRLYRFADGTPLARLPAGEAVDIPVEVNSAPAVEQTVVLAVARHARDLPASQAETEDLLTCLNDSLPPARIEYPGQPAEAARGCLPQGVTVLPKSIAWSGQ